MMAPLSEVADAQSEVSDPPKLRFDVVLTNPPFGKKSAVTSLNDDRAGRKEVISYRRDDFWASTSNKQLNFLQHVFSLLRPDGRAAVVVPDNVLFEGGAGEVIRRKLLEETNLHTILRLPTGIFYAQGVKANVLFFERKGNRRENVGTSVLWIYDFRTNMHFTLKERPLRKADLEDFVRTCRISERANRKESDRLRAFAAEDLLQRDRVNLDITWLRDESFEDISTLPLPHIIASDIAEDLEAALQQFSLIAEEIPPS